jgi:hypothetical protein
VSSGNSRSQTVWSDVHPGNIFIDTNFDAWVVDLRGGWVEEFADSKKADTKEADVQGIRRNLNGFLETWTLNDIEALLVSEKVANIK